MRPDTTATTHEIGVQASESEVDIPVLAVEDPIEAKGPEPPLIYAALLGAKSEAPHAVKLLLAQINNDHANLPNKILFRVHSD